MTSAAIDQTVNQADILPEDLLRADMYGFLATLLRGEPSDELLNTVVSIKGDPSAIGSASKVLGGGKRTACAQNRHVCDVF